MSDRGGRCIKGRQRKLTWRQGQDRRESTTGSNVPAPARPHTEGLTHLGSLVALVQLWLCDTLSDGRWNEREGREGGGEDEFSSS